MICPVCQSGNTKFSFHCDKYAISFSVHQCDDCLCYFQPHNQEGIKKFYQQEYYTGDANYSYKDERKSFIFDNHVWQARLKSIKKYHKNAKTFLDVGCAFGGFTLAASTYFDSYGIDLSHYAVEQGNIWQGKSVHKNLKFKGLSIGSLENYPPSLLSKKFDIITLIEVAEHLSQPILDFKKAFDLLNSKGVLVIQTANFEGRQAKKLGQDYHYFMPGHLVYYRASALKQLLKNVGFCEFKEFFPTDFSLIAKLRKSRGGFSKAKDYFKWVRISYYHLISKFHLRGVSFTSSYVLYARK